MPAPARKSFRKKPAGALYAPLLINVLTAGLEESKNQHLCENA